MTSKSSSRGSRPSGRSHLQEAMEQDAARREAEAQAEAQVDIPAAAAGTAGAQTSGAADGGAVWASVVARERSNGKVKLTVHVLAAKHAYLRRAAFLTDRSMSDLVDQALTLLEAELALDS